MIDITQIKLAGQFEIFTDSLGTLVVRGIKQPDLEYLISNYDDIRKADPEIFIRDLAARLCRKKEDAGSESEKDRKEDVARLTAAELELLASQIIENNQHILKTDEQKERGETGGGKDKAIPQLQNLLQAYIRKYERLSRKGLKSIVPKGLFSDEVGRLAREATRFSEMLGDEIKKTSQYSDLSFSPKDYPAAIQPHESPIYETNRKLSRMDEKLDQSANLLRVMNDLGNQMSFEQARSQKRFSRFNSILIALALVSLVVSACFSYLDYRSSVATNKVMNELLEHTQSLRPLEAADNGQAQSGDSEPAPADVSLESDHPKSESTEQDGTSEAGESRSPEEDG